MIDSLNMLLLNNKNALKDLLLYDKFPTHTKVKVVLGNEACDLDSTVSCLVYSLFLAQMQPFQTIIPVINVKQIDFPVKSEVNYFCKECEIEIQDFIFRDQIDLVKLKDTSVLQLVLVDHHTLTPEDEPLRSAVVEVIDHRPKDPSSHWPTETKECIELVGSCSTLIASKLLSAFPKLVTPNIAKLLYGTIVLDTACFSKTAGIAKQLDFEVADKLQQICSGLNTEGIFQSINNAKSDISGLTTRQVLIKDLKVTSNIPIIGVPILVQDFLKIPDAPISLAHFCDERAFKLAVVMGLNMSSSDIQRDISIYWHSQDMEAMSGKLVEKLQESGFELVQVTLAELSEHFSVYKQNNIMLSRKKLLPIVRAVGRDVCNKL